MPNDKPLKPPIKITIDKTFGLWGVQLHWANIVESKRETRKLAKQVQAMFKVPPEIEILD